MSGLTAVLGASGFVGSRLLEQFHLCQVGSVRPIVRSYGSLARLARFDFDWHLADGLDHSALAKAFEGCDCVVNLLVADPAVIIKNAAASYLAAESAGVKRLIFLSSASVHGQAPPLGTDESSPLHTNHRLAYNNAKVRAERVLTQLRARGSVELVILRPAIVYGPRSRWIIDLANQISTNKAYLINEGAGICNSIYVDNLIHAIHLASTVPGVDRQVFFVGDRERVTWLDFYATVASALDKDLSTILRLTPPSFPRHLKDSLKALKASKPVQSLLPFAPGSLKLAVKGAIKAASAPPAVSKWQLPASSLPSVTEEMTQLQLCSVQLSSSKAEHMLGYQPPVTFAEGMKRSLAWLQFAGYPIQSL